MCIIQCCGILSPGFLNTCIHNTYNIIVYVSLTGTSIGVRSVSYLNREFLLASSVVLQANFNSSLFFKYSTSILVDMKLTWNTVHAQRYYVCA